MRRRAPIALPPIAVPAAGRDTSPAPSGATPIAPVTASATATTGARVALTNYTVADNRP